MSNALDFCENAVVVRHAEVAKIMQQVEVKRIKLFSRIQNEEVDEADALCRNRTLPGSLGMVWNKFLALPKAQKLCELNKSEFDGMSWQSLLQCSPYF